MSLQVCSCCGWSKVTTYHGLRTHQGKMGCTPNGVEVQQSKEPQYTWGYEGLTNSQKELELDVYTPTKADTSLQECHCGWSKFTTYHGLRIHQGKMGCTPNGVKVQQSKQPQYTWGYEGLTNSQKELELDVYTPTKADMSLQECHCGWSKVTTYHGLRIHQGKMGCTPNGVEVQQSKQPQYTWGYEGLTNCQKELELDVYTPTKADTSLQECHCGWSKFTTYHGLRIHQGKMGCTPNGVKVQQSKQPQYTWGYEGLTNSQKELELDVYTPTKADTSLQKCHCGWSRFTTYHGLRIHQGKMGCTPKGVRIPEKDQWDWNKWDEVAQRKDQPEKRGTVKKEVKHPTPTYPVRGDRLKKKEREDQTVSQISDSRKMTGNWSVNSRRHSPLANPNFSTDMQVRSLDMDMRFELTLVQEISDVRAKLKAVHPKEKDQADRKLTQVRSGKIPADTTVKHKTQTREQMAAQGRSSVKARMGMDADWLEIDSVFSGVVRAANDAKQKSLDHSFSTLRTTTSTMMEQIHRQLEKLSAIELKWISKFAVDVKLDPTTAHRCFVSADGKKVRSREYQDAPGRFGSVLGLNSLTPGKSYWEVVVSDNTGWNLGVARDDANHKGKPSLNPDNGYWVTEHYKNKYTALTDTPVRLSLKEKPQKVGVFVDYKEGLVSFYDVTAQSHIYSFTECWFNGDIYPYFSLHLKGDGESADPLIISAVKHQ